MPRKTKEQKELENEKLTTNQIKKSNKTDSKSSSKKDDIKKPAKTAKKAATATKSSTTKTSQAAKKDNIKSTTKKTTATSKSTSSKSSRSTKTNTTKTTRKSTSKKETTKSTVSVVEYYDLPYRYNQTVVKVLAQTPTTLFIYWDISDDDRKKYVEEYGENFFETTKPVLKIFNDTLNYNFEIDINDFANSWYLHVNDSNCDYRVELGRRPIQYSEKNPNQYIYISQSNEIEAPNDKILFDKNQKMVYFKNIKTNTKTKKSLANISFIRNMGKIYNIYDLYKQIYKDQDIDEFNQNPSSGSF